MPRASIIIPSHQRAGLLPRTLDALATQTCPATEYEVIIAADACTDDTVRVVTEYASNAPFRLRVVNHEARSAAATRNLGAGHAAGNILIFLDDDVEALPSLVEAHLTSFSPDTVTLGYAKPVLAAGRSQFQMEIRFWWEDAYREMGRPGHRFTYRDLFGNNFSLDRELFQKCGGFDPSFPAAGREDYEFGYRLIRMGARFQYAPTAVGIHQDIADFPRWLRRQRQAGVAEVRIATRHPELRHEIFDSVHPWIRRLGRLAFAMHGRGETQVRTGTLVAAWLECLNLRPRRRSLMNVLGQFNYWRGVAEQFSSREGFEQWLEECADPAVLALDSPVLDLCTLPHGAALAGLLSDGTAKGLRVLIHGVPVLTFAPQPGAEPLQEEHIRLALRQVSAAKFVPGLALHRVMDSEGRLC